MIILKSFEIVIYSTNRTFNLIHIYMYKYVNVNFIKIVTKYFLNIFVYSHYH